MAGTRTGGGGLRTERESCDPSTCHPPRPGLERHRHPGTRLPSSSGSSCSSSTPCAAASCTVSWTGPTRDRRGGRRGDDAGCGRLGPRRRRGRWARPACSSCSSGSDWGWPPSSRAARARSPASAPANPPTDCAQAWAGCPQATANPQATPEPAGDADPAAAGAGATMAPMPNPTTLSDAARAFLRRAPLRRGRHHRCRRRAPPDRDLVPAPARRPDPPQRAPAPPLVRQPRPGAARLPSRSSTRTTATAGWASPVSWTRSSDDVGPARDDIVALANRYHPEGPDEALIAAFRTQPRITYLVRVTGVHDHLED